MKVFVNPKEEATIGKSTTKIGVSKQWTAHINAMPTPKRSSQAYLAQARVSVDELRDICFFYLEGELFAR